jgi:hypothetical protein
MHIILINTFLLEFYLLEPLLMLFDRIIFKIINFMHNTR